MKDKKILEAKIENLYPLLDAIDAAIEPYGCSPEVLTTIHICIEEIFVNIVSYAYGEDGGKVEIDYDVTEHGIEITFIDEGVPYNPLEQETPDLDLSAEEREIGGLGIFMVRTMMDKIDYEFKEERNCLSMQKNFQ